MTFSADLFLSFFSRTRSLKNAAEYSRRNMLTPEGSALQMCKFGLDKLKIWSSTDSEFIEKDIL